MLSATLLRMSLGGLEFSRDGCPRLELGKQLNASCDELKRVSEPWSSSKGVEQVKAIEPHPCMSCLAVKAWRGSF